MKAKKTRQLLDELDCQACGYAKEMLEKGFCFHSCEDNYRLEDELEVELTELERLAEIGKALERATKMGTAWVFVESIGECTYPSEEEIQSLVLWYRECNKEFYAI